jgi:hypothetical protein
MYVAQMYTFLEMSWAGFNLSCSSHSTHLVVLDFFFAGLDYYVAFASTCQVNDLKSARFVNAIAGAIWG